MASTDKTTPASKTGSGGSKKEFLIRERNIPAPLREHPHWLIWRYEKLPTDKPGTKPRKMPYYPHGGKRWGVLGGKKDVAKLRDFKDAIAAAKDRGFDGVGLAVLPEQDITILDLDNCIDDDGVYSDFAQTLIESGSYVERSPSGRGLRAVYAGALLGNEKRNFHIENGERVEVYCGNAYTTFTGNKVPDAGSGIERLPKAIKRTLQHGMKVSGVDGENVGGEGVEIGEDGEPLLSMNAVQLPNMTPAQALRVLKGLPSTWGAPESGTWFQVAAALHLQFEGSDEGYEVLDAWSSERDGYDPEANRQRWDAGFSHARGKQNLVSMRNLVFEARDAGAKFKQSTLESWGLTRAAQEKAAESEIELPDDELSEEIERAWRPVSFEGWGTEERPAGAAALVKGWIYEGAVTLFSSHGGGGKSYVSMTFAALAAAASAAPENERQWFGRVMKPGKVLVVNGEDPLVEVRHRLWGICAAYGVDIEGLAGHLDIVDVTPVLHKALYTAGTDFGKTEFTKQYHKMCETVRANGYKYIVLDNLSKFYMANENARPMVDEFISSLAAVAAEVGAGVLLVGHASKLGTDGYSGSTAWHNSARARWSLNVKEGTRELMVEKNNYGETGHGGRWVWDDTLHVIRMDEAVGAGTASSEFQDVELLEGVRDTVIDLYSRETWTYQNTRGTMGAIEHSPFVLGNGITHAKLRELLTACVAENMLEIETYKDAKRREKHRFCPPERDLI